MRALVVLGAVVLALGSRQLMAGTPQSIFIHGRESGMRALVFEPDEASGAHPAVIALHGCAGLFMRDGSLNPRHRAWGTRLAAAGFVVVMPDSFGSRAVVAQCRYHQDVVSADERIVDAEDARAYLLSRSDVKTDAISLLGWSSGGSAVLEAVGSNDEAVRRHDFAKAVAFYPDCHVALKSETWQPRLPLLILIGGADDWNPASSCLKLRLVSSRSAVGNLLSVKVYPGALHDFDQPGLERQERDNRVSTADGAGEASVGTNPLARDDALALVPAYLAR